MRIREWAPRSLKQIELQVYYRFQLRISRPNIDPLKRVRRQIKAHLISLGELSSDLKATVGIYREPSATVCSSYTSDGFKSAGNQRRTNTDRQNLLKERFEWDSPSIDLDNSNNVLSKVTFFLSGD